MECLNENQRRVPRTRPPAKPDAHPGFIFPLPSRNSSVGNSHNPPFTPSAGRCRTSHLPDCSSTNTRHRQFSNASRFVTCGKFPTAPRRRASHDLFSGHTSHCAPRGRQTIAPSSINDWFKSPHLPVALTIAFAKSHSHSFAVPDFTSPSTANTRANTRATLPSTTGSGLSNAMLATAPAVYRPTPGSPLKASASRGTSPPCSFTITRAAFCRFRARE